VLCSPPLSMHVVLHMSQTLATAPLFWSLCKKQGQSGRHISVHSRLPGSPAAAAARLLSSASCAAWRLIKLAMAPSGPDTPAPPANMREAAAYLPPLLARL